MAKRPHDFTPQVTISDFLRILTCYHQDVKARSNMRALSPEQFPNAAAQLVSHGCPLVEFASNCDSQAAMGKPVLVNQQEEMFGIQFSSLALQGQKLPASFKPQASGKTLRAGTLPGLHHERGWPLRGDVTAILWRPLARRALSTLRPPLVCILLRNP